MLIKSLIWDADGTLFDTYPAIYRSLEQALSTDGIFESREEIVRLCQIDMPTCFSTLAKRHGLDEPLLVSRYQEVRKAYSFTHQPLFPGLEDLCVKFMASGGKHYIVTHRDRTSLLLLLDENRCTHWFTDIVAGDDNYPRKPDPTGLTALIERNDIDIETALFVGDRELDIKTAHNVGMRACQFGSALTNTTPDIRIMRYQQLMNVLVSYN